MNIPVTWLEISIINPSMNINIEKYPTCEVLKIRLGVIFFSRKTKLKQVLG